MPYNNSAIPPPEEITGSASLPLARVKRILQLDEDIHQCSNNGAFIITIATEMFIQYLAEQAMNVVKSERKPRRNIQYKDFANAVARIDNLEFLSDVIPKTTTYREYKEKKSRIKRPHAPAQNGQTTLDGTRSLPSRPADMINPTERAVEQGGASSRSNLDGSNTKQPTVLITQPNGKFVYEHFEPHQESRRDEVGDVIMD